MILPKSRRIDASGLRLPIIAAIHGFLAADKGWNQRRRVVFLQS